MNEGKEKGLGEGMEKRARERDMMQKAMLRTKTFGRQTGAGFYWKMGMNGHVGKKKKRAGGHSPADCSTNARGVGSDNGNNVIRVQRVHEPRIHDDVWSELQHERILLQ